jgi:hypothetical protein
LAQQSYNEDAMPGLVPGIRVLRALD